MVKVHMQALSWEMSDLSFKVHKQQFIPLFICVVLVYNYASYMLSTASLTAPSGWCSHITRSLQYFTWSSPLCAWPYLQHAIPTCFKSSVTNILTTLSVEIISTICEWFRYSSLLFHSTSMRWREDIIPLHRWGDESDKDQGQMFC